jgi:predicted Zn-dependent protease
MPRKWIALLLMPGLLGAQAPPESSKELKESVTFVVELAKHYEILEDHPDLERVTRIGYTLVKAIDRPKGTYSFQIVKMPEPNAFALPAGFIFLTTGLLELGLSDDAVAAVLGHEIIHAQNEHSREMQRKQTLLGILGNALVLGALFGASRSGPSRPAPGQPDPFTTPDSVWSQGQNRHQSEAASIVQASLAFSVVMQALLMQGYSRDNEMESDREGTYLMAQAGFDPKGVLELLEAMRKRTYEAPGYGYWRSHPYLEERARTAEARAGRLKAASERPDPSGTQRAAQETLFRLAQAEKDPARAGALERLAVSASPTGLTSFLLRRKALDQMEDRLRAAPFPERDYGVLLQGYRRLLDRFRDDPETAASLQRAQADYDRLREENEGCRPAFVGILDFGVPSVAFLKAFASNYPDDPRAPYAALLQSRNQFQLGEEEEAVEALERAWASPDPMVRDWAEASVLARLHQVRSLTACQRLADAVAGSALEPLVRQRFETVLPLLDSLKAGRAFLDAYPASPTAGRVRARMETLAEAEWVKARVYQKMGDEQRALNALNAVLENAPETAAAERIRADILKQANLEGGSPS